MSEFGLFGKFTVKEGERESLVKILLEAAKSMENLDGCKIYHVSTCEDEPNSVFVYELWSSEHAHRESLNLESTQYLITHAKPIITGMERIATLKPEGGKVIS